MNNILPRVVRMHLKYDLKGSTYKRRASKKEREKAKPTFKDLDFMQDIPEGLMLDADTYSALVKTLQRDCLVRASCFFFLVFILYTVHETVRDLFCTLRLMLGTRSYEAATSASPKNPGVQKHLPGSMFMNPKSVSTYGWALNNETTSMQRCCMKIAEEICKAECNDLQIM